MDKLSFFQIWAGLGGFAAGFFVACLFAAILLRVASQILKFEEIPYLHALKIVLISNFVVAALNFSIGFNHGFNQAIFDRLFEMKSRSMNLAISYSPIYFLYATTLAVLATAVIFCRTLPTRDKTNPILFRDSVALASLYLALTFAAITLLGLIVFSVLGLIWAS